MLSELRSHAVSELLRRRSYIREITSYVCDAGDRTEADNHTIMLFIISCHRSIIRLESPFEVKSWYDGLTSQGVRSEAPPESRGGKIEM